MEPISPQALSNLAKAFANLQPQISVGANKVTYKRNKKDTKPITFGMTPNVDKGAGYTK